MSVTAMFEERVLFSPNLPEAVNRLLQQAVAANHADKPLAEQLFKQALALDGACLQSYFALYKFYFYQARLAEAEQAALAGLNEAARQGGLPEDFCLLASGDQDLYRDEVRLFYLYTLKALAFIRLRLGRDQQSKQILDLLLTIDPEDRCGASVIRSLADALALEAA